jgi:hypothetical protein
MICESDGDGNYGANVSRQSVAMFGDNRLKMFSNGL